MVVLKLLRNNRRLVFIAGALLVGFAILALVYAWWPAGSAGLQATLPATLFAPP